MRKIYLLFLGLFLLLTACTPQKDLLIGKWKVVMVDRDGHRSGGPTFRGSTFEFSPQGKVIGINQTDSMVVDYRREGENIIYSSDLGEEVYKIDSLTERVLVLSYNNEGIPTITRMIRVK